jgi:glutathione S-transferase
MLLTLAKQPFVDQRVDFEEFAKLKPTLPGGSLPVFQEEGGRMLYQTVPIMRALGIKYSFYPKDAARAFDQDWIIETLIDAGESGTVLYLPTNPEWNEERMTSILKKFDQLCKHLEKYLDDNRRDYFGGSGP